MKHIILASQSPRRKQLLAAMGVEFETIPSKFDEYLDDARDPELVAKELALGKALDVAKDNQDAYVIGSDTIVTIDGQQLAKPETAEEAHDMLKSLAGKPNYVTTGLAVVCVAANVRLTAAVTATVWFKLYDQAAVHAYVATGDPLDKAGGYGMQHPLCEPLIDRIEGDTDVIVGLPTAMLASLLHECGIEAVQVSNAEVARIVNQ